MTLGCYFQAEGTEKTAFLKCYSRQHLGDRCYRINVCRHNVITYVHFCQQAGVLKLLDNLNYQKKYWKNEEVILQNGNKRLIRCFRVSAGCSNSNVIVSVFQGFRFFFFYFLRPCGNPIFKAGEIKHSNGHRRVFLQCSIFGN